MSLIVETDKGTISFGNERVTSGSGECQVTVCLTGGEQPVIQEWVVLSSREPLSTPRVCPPEYDDKGRLRLYHPFDQLATGSGIPKRKQRTSGISIISANRKKGRPSI